MKEFNPDAYQLPAVEPFPQVPLYDYSKIYTEILQYKVSLSYPEIPNMNDLHRLSKLYDVIQSYRERIGELQESVLIHQGNIDDLKSIYNSYYTTSVDILITYDTRIRNLDTIQQRTSRSNEVLRSLVDFIESIKREAARAKVCLNVLEQRKRRLETANFNLKDQIATLRLGLNHLSNPTHDFNSSK